ncbi:DUF4387 domain-containing protein [Falsirhodobacter halotolerans]|uniref:DUF4387 domain-containing protein n=1 Tax=Falsirhodobacter halotolerans TaxID=1146892 RepID=UPI001FD1ACA7|nr:DUF4387 domain-containing protein [Falsirhodobacter halotolerans]MCJ8140955.1 DUF4387 domain-containing protein [Falsirhodobacter halotolerans]
MALIRDIAQICKSKNAGPFNITIDVLFEDHALYHRVKATGVLSAPLFARLYGVSVMDVLFTPYDTAAAFKATFPRRIPAGDFGDTDVYGAQQHAPLLDIDIPLD